MNSMQHNRRDRSAAPALPAQALRGGPSPAAQGWRAPAWHTAVLYRVEALRFTPVSRLAALAGRLDSLAQLGITVLELAGPAAAAVLADPTGSDELATLRDAAHRRGIALTLALAGDVRTPSGASTAIRQVLHALEDCGLDGVRLEGGLLHAGTRAGRVRAAIAAAVRRGCGRRRKVYLTLGAPAEGDRSMASGLPAGFDARWHVGMQAALRAMLRPGAPAADAGYGAASPQARLCRALARGIEPSLPCTAAIVGLQATGVDFASAQRHGVPAVNAAALAAARALLLLGPAPPQLVQGEEWDAPGDPRPEPHAVQMLDQCRRLLAVRHRDIVQLLPGLRRGACVPGRDGGAFALDWRLADGSALHLLANLTPVPRPAPRHPAGRLLFATHPNIRAAVARNELEPWSVTWLLERTRFEH